MKTSIRLNFISLLIFIMLFNCCKKTNDTNNTIKITKVKITGYVQKGPFINGTNINIFELNESLIQTGKVFNTSITNNIGSFEINNIELSSQFVQFNAFGFYFNENTGNNSDAQITLNALSDLTDISSVNVNVLTHLEKSRVEYLVNKKLSFHEAKDSAQKEILAIFGIVKNDLVSSEKLNIFSNSDNNAILLAVSVILQGQRSIADLSEIMSNIITDINEDGILNDEKIKSELFNSTAQLDLIKIRSNISNHYKDLGLNDTVPNFEKYIKVYLDAKTPFKIEAKIKNIICNGSNDGEIHITIKDGKSIYQYSWSNGNTTADNINLKPGNYSVTVTDGNNYSQIKSFVITDPSKIVINGNVTNTTTCDNSDGSIIVSITGGVSPYSCLWSNNDTGKYLKNIKGQYSITITDSIGCSQTQNFNVLSPVCDICGNKYKTAQIGDQIWMIENLKTNKFNDGSAIRLLKSTGDLDNFNEGYCWYNFDSAQFFNSGYGALYTYNIVNSNKLCPQGWHVPTTNEFIILQNFTDCDYYAGNLREAGTLHWGINNEEGNNKSGFTAIPAGIYSNNPSDKGFNYMGTLVSYWLVNDKNSFIVRLGNAVKLYTPNYNDAYSVRCVEDK